MDTDTQLKETCPHTEHLCVSDQAGQSTLISQLTSQKAHAGVSGSALAGTAVARRLYAACSPICRDVLLHAVLSTCTPCKLVKQ